MARIAAIQMNTGADVGANLALAGELLAEAARDACTMAVLPENFALMAARAAEKLRHAETPGAGPVQSFLAETAERLGLWIVGGSIALTSPESTRVFGACVVVDSNGITRCIYHKIHLFDVDLAESGESYRESSTLYPGDDTALLDSPAGCLGLTICYDLRFPELFRSLVDQGATLFTVPAAFTDVTGRAHWHLLLRARAVENLAYVVAPNQVGLHADGRATYGHSLIVDPWGKVLAEVPEGNGIAVADIDPALVHRLRNEFPVLANRRLQSIASKRDLSFPTSKSID